MKNMVSFITYLLKVQLTKSIKQIIRIVRQFMSIKWNNVIAPVLTGNLKPNTESNALIDQQNTSIKVYKVDNAADLSESYFVNPENFEDVTNSVNITFPNPNQYKVEFNTPDDQITTPYIVVVNGHIDLIVKVI